MSLQETHSLVIFDNVTCEKAKLCCYGSAPLKALAIEWDRKLCTRKKLTNGGKANGVGQIHVVNPKMTV